MCTIIFQTVGFVLHLGVAGGTQLTQLLEKNSFSMGTSLNEVTQFVCLNWVDVKHRRKWDI